MRSNLPQPLFAKEGNVSIIMLTAIVLTRNEEKNIPDCLATLSWTDELLVIDSGSTDETVALVTKHGARVVQNFFVDFASQRNFAMRQAKGEWVFFVDADERVTSALAEEIQAVLRQGPSPCIYKVPRRTFFFGHLLRFSDARHDAPARLFPRDGVTWEQPVHEQISSELPSRALKNPLLHYSTRDLNHYKAKICDYIPLELVTMREKGIRPGWGNIFFRPAAKFFYLYFWKLGVLDGIAGLQYAILSAYYTAVKHWRYLMLASGSK